MCNKTIISSSTYVRALQDQLRWNKKSLLDPAFSQLIKIQVTMTYSLIASFIPAISFVSTYYLKRYIIVIKANKMHYFSTLFW